MRSILAIASTATLRARHPTGIDIRNGLQNESGCAACIDARDDVMDRMGTAKGLIRYSTENGVARGLARSGCCAAWPVRGCFDLRRPARRAVCRAGGEPVAAADFGSTSSRPGSPGAVADDGSVESVYQLHQNATERPCPWALASEGNLRDAISATGLYIVTPTSTLEAAASGKLPLRRASPPTQQNHYGALHVHRPRDHRHWRR